MNFMAPLFTIDVNVSVGIFAPIEGGMYIAYCPHLRLSGYGATKQEAREDFDKAMKVFLAFHMDHNNLAETLRKFGWNVEVGSNEVNPPEKFELPSLYTKNSKEVEFYTTTLNNAA